MAIAVQRKLRAPFFADSVLLGLTVLAVGFSLVMVYSTTGVVSQERFGDSLYFVRRQGLAALLGLAVLLMASRINVAFLKRYSPFFLLAAIIMLLLPLVSSIAFSSGGAQRWVGFGGVNFQPGEFAKVCIVIFMAGYLERQEEHLGSFASGVVKPLLLVSLLSALFLAQPDFGSCVIITLVVFGMGAASGVRLWHLFISGLVGAATFASLVIVSPYRLKRVLSFLEPAADASGSGYQLMQSLIAVGSGRLSGVGLGASQQKLFFLPAAHTDFIFAVVAEELGFVGSSLVVVMFLIFFWRGLQLAGRVVENTFAYALSVGLTLLIVVPALLNVGVVIGLLPTKGLVLPLIGYGGSSLLASLLTVGLLLGLARGFYTDKIGLFERATRVQ